MPRIDRRTAFTVLVLCTLVLFTAPLGAQMPEPQHAHDPAPSILVNGSGEVRAEPDEATVRLGVVAQEPTAREAQNEASRIAGAILSAIAALDVPREAIQTSQLYLTPVYEQGRSRQAGQQVPTEPRIIAYRASNTVSIRLADLARIGPVIDAGIDAGANQVEGVSFQLRDDRAAREEAMRLAVTEARSKAGAMADALDVDLGPVVEAQEGGYSIERPQYAQPRMMAMEASMADTPVAAGQVTVSASVSLRYRIGR